MEKIVQLVMGKLYSIAVYRVIYIFAPINYRKIEQIQNTGND